MGFDKGKSRVKKIDRVGTMYKIAVENVGWTYAAFSALACVRVFFVCGAAGPKSLRSQFCPCWTFFWARNRRMDAGKPLFEKMLNFLHICLFFC